VCIYMRKRLGRSENEWLVFSEELDALMLDREARKYRFGQKEWNLVIGVSALMFIIIISSSDTFRCFCCYFTSSLSINN
jgi:hypothetical protein